MAAHNPEESAGGQLALTVAVKLLLTSFRGNPQAADTLEAELESLRADILAGPLEESKIDGFEAMAEALMQTIRPTS